MVVVAVEVKRRAAGRLRVERVENALPLLPCRLTSHSVWAEYQLKINVGHTIPKQHEFDLALEKDAVTRLNEGIQLCRTKKDNGSRILLEKILRDEEEHIDWLEAQLRQIQDLGLDNYLAQQLGD